MTELGVECAVNEYLHPGFRVRVERVRGMTYDEALVYPHVGFSGIGDRPRLDVVLRGHVRDTENGTARWLDAGGFAIGRALDSLYMRMQSQDVLCLGIEWNLGTLGTSAPTGLPTGALDARDREALTASAEALLAGDEEGHGGPLGRGSSIRIIADVLTRLRAAGLPFDVWRARDIVAPVPEPCQRVARALGRALSRLDLRPSSRDLEAELGVSRRRVADLVAEFGARFGINGGRDWRTMRDQWRLVMSVMAMSNPRARTEDVARAVGYGSANALCHACREAGLPSPGAVRGLLAGLL